MADRVDPAGLSGWLRRHIPTRETLADSNWLRPVSGRLLRPELWRFTRRSVPRGVALGVATGILMPVAHMPLAAVLALPIRANIPAAVATTLISNPVTVPPIWLAAYWLGRRILRLDHGLPGQPIAAGLHVASQQGWLTWFLSDGAPATATGLIAITIVAAVIGYTGSSMVWRWRIGRKWRRRGSGSGFD